MITSQFCGEGNRSTLSSSLDGTPVTTPVTGGRFPKFPPLKLLWRPGRVLNVGGQPRPNGGKEDASAMRAV